MNPSGRWAKSSPGARQRRVVSNRLWRARNRDAVRLWGRDNYRRDPAKYRDLAMQRWNSMPEEQKAIELQRSRVRSTTSRNANPDKWTSAYMRNNYGITLQQFEKMLAQQNGVCAICKEPEKAQHQGKVKRLSIDHCHKTGRVRGLLCVRCNVTLGRCKESTALLRGMADWLESQR